MPMTAGAEVVEDYGQVGLSLRAHPLSFLRQNLAARRIRPCAEATALKDGRRASLAGLVLVRQKPATATGVVFVTIEDETGIANLVVWRDVYEKHRRILLTARMIAAHGKVQREGEVVHVVVDRLEDLTPDLARIGDADLAVRSRDFH